MLAYASFFVIAIVAIDLANGQGQCGKVRNRGSEDRHPWLAYLQFNYGGTSQTDNCAGIVLSNRAILTAAHCVRTNRAFRDAYVYLGRVHLNRQSRGHKNLRAFSMTQHRRYDANKNIFDLAIVKTNQEFQFSRAIRPVCLQSACDAGTPSASARKIDGCRSVSILTWTGLARKSDGDIVSARQCQRELGTNIDRRTTFCVKPRDISIMSSIRELSGAVLCIDDNGVHSLLGIVAKAEAGKPLVVSRTCHQSVLRWFRWSVPGLVIPEESTTTPPTTTTPTTTTTSEFITTTPECEGSGDGELSSGCTAIITEPPVTQNSTGSGETIIFTTTEEGSGEASITTTAPESSEDVPEESGSGDE